MEIDIDKIRDLNINKLTDQCVKYEEFNSSVTLLGWVCTARLIQGLVNNREVVKMEVEHWIKMLTNADDLYEDQRVSNLGASYVFYKPQSLVAITTKQQGVANEVLLELGFEPSRPVLNMKYGAGRELITWTYALHGFLEEGE
tara:strand:+ start:27463 stop:27891 length:429 start_codon:yes stop_codon:yes gene_type:complete